MKTIDDICGKGSFRKFLKKKEAFLKKNEADRKRRIRAHRAGKSIRPTPTTLIGCDREAFFFKANEQLALLA